MTTNIPLSHSLTWDESDLGYSERTTRLPQPPQPVYISAPLRDTTWPGAAGDLHSRTTPDTNRQSVKRSTICLNFIAGLTFFLLCGIVIASGMGAENALHFLPAGQQSEIAEMFGTVLAPMQLIVVLLGCVYVVITLKKDMKQMEASNSYMWKRSSRILFWAGISYFLTSIVINILALGWSSGKFGVAVFLCGQFLIGGVAQLPCIPIAWLCSRHISTSRLRWGGEAS